MNGRHWVCFNYAICIVSTNLRANIDYVFLLRENIYSNRKKLYEQYAGSMFPTFKCLIYNGSMYRKL